MQSYLAEKESLRHQSYLRLGEGGPGNLARAKSGGEAKKESTFALPSMFQFLFHQYYYFMFLGVISLG